MPTRIYQLAKDLKIDSKELVDLCTKAGILGKGSALASLEDDEISKLKAFLDGGSAKRAAPANPTLVDTKAVLSSPVMGSTTLPPPPPSRSSPAARSTPPAPAQTPSHAPVEAPAIEPVAPATTPPVGPAPETSSPPPVAAPTTAPPAIAAKLPQTAAPPSPPVVAAPPVAPVAPALSPPSVSARSKETISAKVGAKSSSSPSVDLAPVRQDSLSPTRRGGIKVLDTATKRGATDGRKREGEATTPGRPGVKRAPVIRVADMPEMRQPAVTSKQNEPPAQKPIIRLPGEAIRGGGAPLGEITKGLEKKHMAGVKDAGKKGVKTGIGEPAVSPLDARGKKKPRGAEDEGKSAGSTLDKVRADRQRARGGGRTNMLSDSDQDGGRNRRRRGRVHISSHGSTAAPRKEKVGLQLPCTVRTFSEAAGVNAAQVMKTLMGLGVMVNINAAIPDEYVDLVAAELGVELQIKQAESLEDQVALEFAEENDDPALLVPRPPIVTFLGHVDHGKTSLLDKIIGTNVVAGEAGGITQHIRAYTITTKDGRVVSFVDTPGHEAFTEMRARGANVTDIAVLVVAADDGMMRQTEEALSHAKAADVPIVVAMNKIDLPGADQQKVLQQLATAGLLPSEWGGETEVIRTSAMTGEGMDTLLETLLVTAELNEYKANPSRPASGTCLEAEQQAGRGVIAKLMVQNGTLKEGDVVVCGAGYGRVKAMYDTLRPRQKLATAGPSTPVNVTGLDEAPGAGDKFYVLQDIAQARELAAQRANQSRQQTLSGGTTKVSFEDFQERLAEGRLGQEEVSTLHLIVRADVRGSIEAILNELGKFDHPEVKLKVLHASVGGVSVADVTLAHASGAVIIAFNVIPDEAARALAEERQVEIRRYEIIYKVTDDIKALLEGKLKPEERVVEMGRALVKQVFTISRVGAVAGCQIIQGNIERSCRVRINRESRTIGDYALDSLRREKDDVKEVSRGMECGIKLANFNDIKEGDLLEAYRIEEVARTL